MKKFIHHHTLLAIIRIFMGFMFLWAFLDKTFGLGFATERTNAWIHGGSPTFGFLTHAVQGPFASFFHSLAGIGIIDWLFMIGLLVVGVTLLINRYVKIGSTIGFIMTLLMYFAVLWPTNNPFIDEHLIYALIFAYLIEVESRKK